MSKLHTKFKVPKDIKIGGYTYEVEFVPKLSLDNEPMFGVHHYSDGMIYLNADSTSLDQVRNTVWHEVFHAMWHHMALDTKIEEEYVTKLSTALVMVLKDNPKLKTLV